MATDPVDSSQIGPHLRVPKRRGEQGVRVCPPLVPAGNGLQTAGNNTFSPAPNTCVSAGTLDGVDESPVPSTKIIQGRQLPRNQRRAGGGRLWSSETTPRSCGARRVSDSRTTIRRGHRIATLACCMRGGDTVRGVLCTE